MRIKEDYSYKKSFEAKKVLETKISEYRKLLNDTSTPNNVLEKRINYLEGLCRGIIITELKKYE